MDDDDSIAQAMQRLANVAINECDEPHVRSVLAQIGQVQQWLDHRKVALTRRLQQLAVATPSIQPQQVLASATNISRLEAYREVSRATTLGQFPQLEQAFNDGNISTAHIDALSRAAHHLNPDERQLLAQRSEWLNTVAAHATPDNFARAVKSEVARLHADEGITTLQRQRRDTTLRHWVDRESGMFHINGRLDPECGLRIIGRIDNAVETMFHGALPDTCPTDDRKHGHLNALSLVALIDGSVGASSSPNARAEVSVVIDLQTLMHGMHQRSVIRTGHDVELPIETIRRMACEAEIIPVVLGSNGVVLDVGRATRLASRYQRKALGGDVPHVRNPPVLRSAFAVSTSPHSLLARRRINRHEQPGSAVFKPPPQCARGRLEAEHARHRPTIGHHAARGTTTATTPSSLSCSRSHRCCVGAQLIASH